MTHSKLEKRNRSILRGIEFVYLTARDPENFDIYGFDYLFCFNWIYSTSKSSGLRSMALEMGQECAYRWQRNYPFVPLDADADTITHFVFAMGASVGLGMSDSKLKLQIQEAAKRFNAIDYFWFDPAIEPPPTDVPEECGCGFSNSRGNKVCRNCKKALSMMSRYEVWLLALIRSYIGERYGVVLGARYIDVLKWLPKMRPYCGPKNGYYPDFVWAIYAVTHVVYTLNDYGSYNLSPQWLPNEFSFLKKHVREAIAMNDPETMGEILDSLKSFGLTAEHPLIRKGEEFILSTQNPDGSWGELNAKDIYERYHATVTAINGLREYAWRGAGLSLPEVKPLLDQWANNNSQSE